MDDKFYPGDVVFVSGVDKYGIISYGIKDKIYAVCYLTDCEKCEVFNEDSELCLYKKENISNVSEKERKRVYETVHENGYVLTYDNGRCIPKEYVNKIND